MLHVKTHFQSEIPQEIASVAKALENKGFEAYLVGGCVRDLVLGRSPKDWDITTNAKPEDIQSLFEETFYENTYGTVGVVTKSEDPTLKVIEVTPYRKEGAYSNLRHPDSVSFSDTLEEDLERRDFTINALSYSVSKGQLIDLHKGQEDLARHIVRTVGEPGERFGEDALRMLRAVRIATDLGFTIEAETSAAIQNLAQNIAKISKERVRDEFIKILLTESPAVGIGISEKLGLLKYIAPDLLRGVGVEQNQAHKYGVFEHNLRTLQHAADKGWNLDLRLSGLFHDISKPETRRWSEEKKDWTFHGHDVVGARVTKRVLSEMRFPTKTIEKVVKLVRWHMFFSDPEKITLSAVRRVIRNVGQENVWDLMNLRVCDRIGTGRPKEQPFRLRKYKSMVEEALRDPISVSMLAVDGNALMDVLGEKPGPKIGYILHALLEEVLDDPKKNTREYLEKKSVELGAIPEKELKALGDKGKEKKEEKEEEEIKKIRQKHFVE